MRLITFLSLLLIPACLVIPAHAVVYNEEYHQISDKLSVMSLDNLTSFEIAWGGIVYWDIASYYELRRQTILMEKQNELVEEQNGLLRNLTNQTH